MQIDQTCQDFLQALNDASTLPPLRRLTVSSQDSCTLLQ